QCLTLFEVCQLFLGQCPYGQSIFSRLALFERGGDHRVIGGLFRLKENVDLGASISGIILLSESLVIVVLKTQDCVELIADQFDLVCLACFQVYLVNLGVTFLEHTILGIILRQFPFQFEDGFFLDRCRRQVFLVAAFIAAALGTALARADDEDKNCSNTQKRTYHAAAHDGSRSGGGTYWAIRFIPLFVQSSQR